MGAEKVFIGGKMRLVKGNYPKEYVIIGGSKVYLNKKYSVKI